MEAGWMAATALFVFGVVVGAAVRKNRGVSTPAVRRAEAPARRTDPKRPGMVAGTRYDDGYYHMDGLDV